MRAGWLGVLVLSGLARTAAFADEPFPVQNGRVNDFAKVLDAGAKQRVQGLCDALATDTGVELVVVTVFHAGDRTPHELAQALFAQWGIARQSKGKGILLLLVKNEPKLEVQIGSALEAVLPEAYDVELLLDSAHTQLRLGKLDLAVLAATRELDTRLRQGGESGGLGNDESSEPSDSAASRHATADGDEAASVPSTGFQRSLPGFAWFLIVAAAAASLWYVVSQRLQEKMPDPIFLAAGLGGGVLPILFVLLGVVTPLALLVTLALAATTGLLGYDLKNRQCPKCELWSDPTHKPPDAANSGPPGVSVKSYECRFCGHRFVRPTLMATIRGARQRRRKPQAAKPTFSLNPENSGQAPAHDPHVPTPSLRPGRGLRR